MRYDDRLTSDGLLRAMTALANMGHQFVSSAQLVEATGSSPPAVKRMLPRLMKEARVEAVGEARATRYRLRTAATADAIEKTAVQPPVPVAPSRVAPAWRAASLEFQKQLALPLSARLPVTYRREFVDDYKPNETFLLPREPAEELTTLGRPLGNCRRVPMSARFWRNCSSTFHQNFRETPAFRPGR